MAFSIQEWKEAIGSKAEMTLFQAKYWIKSQLPYHVYGALGAATLVPLLEAVTTGQIGQWELGLIFKPHSWGVYVSGGL